MTEAEWLVSGDAAAGLSIWFWASRRTGFQPVIPNGVRSTVKDTTGTSEISVGHSLCSRPKRKGQAGSLSYGSRTFAAAGWLTSCSARVDATLEIRGEYARPLSPAEKISPLAAQNVTVSVADLLP